MLSPDSPIETADEDKLGRKAFGQALAKALAGFSGEDSFVVGIHGKWGTGKTSILNLLIQQIEKDNETKPDDEKLYVMRFNPWNFSDQNQLIFQFLRQFRAHLKGNQKESKDLLASLNDYAEALAPPLELLPYGRLFSSGMKVGIRGAQKLFGSPKDVNGLFDQIAVKVKKLKRRTAVLIDDIDRLTAAETRQIFQLVKLTARFPFVIYVLAFDKDAVARALEDFGVDSGEEYLEKIVQVSFDIPPISETNLTWFLNVALEDLMKAYKPAHFDSTRFGNLFYSGLSKSFTSLRDIRRFINGLEFSFGLIGGELNAVDFIGIEAIRIFYPKAFNVIRANKKLFAGYVDVFLETTGAEKYAAQLNQLLGANDELTEDLKNILLELFPKLAYAYGRTTYGHAWETEWEKTYRISTTRYFDTYFALTLAESEVSVQEVTSFISCSGSQPELEDILIKWKKEGKLKNAIESVRYRLLEVPVANIQNVLGAFLVAGEIASDQGAVLAGVIPEYMSVRWVIFAILDTVPAKDRVSTVKSSFSSSTSLKTMLNVIALIEESKKENAQRFIEFQDQDIVDIKAIVVRRIRECAKNSAVLLKHPALPAILRVWKQWGGAADEAHGFIAQAIRTDDDFVGFIDKFIYQTHSTAGRVLNVKNRLSMSSLSEWIDLNEATNRLDKITEANLGDAKREVLTVAKSELMRFKTKGLSTEQFDANRFFD